MCSYHIFSCPTRHVLLYFKFNNVTLSVENKTPMEFGHTTVTTTTRLRNNTLLFFFELIDYLFTAGNHFTFILQINLPHVGHHRCGAQ